MCFFFQSIAILALIRTSSVRLCCPGDGGSPFTVDEKEKKTKKKRIGHNISDFRSFRKGADAPGMILFSGSLWLCYCCESLSSSSLSLHVP